MKKSERDVINVGLMNSRPPSPSLPCLSGIQSRDAQVLRQSSGSQSRVESQIRQITAIQSREASMSNQNSGTQSLNCDAAISSSNEIISGECVSSNNIMRNPISMEETDDSESAGRLTSISDGGYLQRSGKSSIKTSKSVHEASGLQHSWMPPYSYYGYRSGKPKYI